jgi:hypothetical protein
MRSKAQYSKPHSQAGKRSDRAAAPTCSTRGGRTPATKAAHQAAHQAVYEGAHQATHRTTSCHGKEKRGSAAAGRAGANTQPHPVQATKQTRGSL